MTFKGTHNLLKPYHILCVEKKRENMLTAECDFWKKKWGPKKATYLVKVYSRTEQVPIRETWVVVVVVIEV